jgi:acetoin utilization protein AcuB
MKDVVADCMSTDVIVADFGVPLAEAVRLMNLNKIRHLCVVSAAGQVVGILSDRDISRALPSALSEASRSEFTRVLEMTHVGQVMTRDPMVVSPTMPLNLAALLLRDYRINALPVVDNDQLVGILTTSDCLSALADSPPVANTEQNAA